MVVRLPETKKYLNRDGLEEYNSLLPHSSTEIQEYVDDWLDAHPEATTTVPDDGITTRKLADGSVTRNKLAADVAHLLGGMMVTGEVQGEILSADDAYSVAPLSMEINGKSTQDGTPTPENPVPIESIEVLELPITFYGKQLMDWEHPFRTGSYSYNIAVGSIITPATSANVEVSMSDGTLVSVINAEWSGTIWRSPNLPNGTYYIHFPNASITGLTGTALGSTLFVVDKNNRCVRKIDTHASTGNWNLAITLSGNEAAICVNAGTRSGTKGTFTYAMPQLEFGSVATAYQNYSSIIANIPMQGHVLRSLPDGTHDIMTLSYLRESDRSGWAWYGRELVQTIGYFLASSPNGWLKSGSALNGYYKNVSQITDGRGKSYVGKGIMSPWFKAANSLNEYFQTINSCWVDSAVSFNIDPDVFSGTALEFGQWVAEHNIEFYMPLDTPATTTLDPIEMPVLPAPNCTVWSDPSTGLKMSYMRDTNIVVSNIEQAIADL